MGNSGVKRRNPTNCLGCMGQEHEGFDPNEIQIGNDDKPKGRITQQSTAYLNPDEINFFKAAAGRNLGLVRFYLTNGVNINILDEDRTSPLHIACRYGSIQVVEELINNGSNLDITDIAGWTPLHVAALYQRSQICQLLLRYGADAKIRNREGNLAQDLVRDKMTSEIFKQQQDHCITVIRQQQQRDMANQQYEEYFQNLKQKKQKNFETSSFNDRDLSQPAYMKSAQQTPVKIKDQDKENFNKVDSLRSNSEFYDQEERESSSNKIHLRFISPSNSAPRFYDEAFSLTQMVFENRVPIPGYKDFIKQSKVTDEVIIDFFNYDCYLAISFLLATQVIKPQSSQIITWVCKDIGRKCKKQITRLISNPILLDQPQLLRLFIDKMVTKVEVILAMREFFSLIQVQNDPYILDIIVKELSQKIYELNQQICKKNNKFPFKTEDSLHMFTFAIVMLDIESRKYSRQNAIKNFIANIQTINNGENFSQQFISQTIDEALKADIVNLTEKQLEQSLQQRLQKYCCPKILLKQKIPLIELNLFKIQDIGIVIRAGSIKIFSCSNSRMFIQGNDFHIESKTQQLHYMVSKDNQTFQFRQRNLIYSQK
ncbi:hypothetical protein pb186bvf_001088 [Paramecium bursaria]